MIMENEIIEELIRKFNARQATGEDIRKIEELLESGQIELSRLDDVHQLGGEIMNMEFPSPGAALDDRFYQRLALEKSARRSFSWRHFFSWPVLAPRLALASLALIVGVVAGYLLHPPADERQMTQLTQQVSELREMMMLSLLERESATDRLKAVSLSQDINEASARVTSALIETLNNDENINVRLAALDALRPYARESSVRQELIRSIARQHSPLVQIALAELMVQLQARSSVGELEKIIQSDSTPADIKKKIKKSIDVLT